MALTPYGNVGIGTTIPETPLQVGSYGSPDQFLTIATGGGNLYRAAVNLRHFNSGYGWTLMSDERDSSFRLLSHFADTDGVTRVFVDRFTGNVGVGTNTPQSKLQVVGNIQLGANGNNYAASGLENLRIVRGSINGDGSIARGSGFTAVHNGPVGTGSYTITFTPAFSGLASVTVTPINVVARANVTGASSVNISTVNFGGGAVDDSFSFIAIGPQ
jgi:hypothetical protein